MKEKNNSSTENRIAVPIPEMKMIVFVNEKNFVSVDKTRKKYLGRKIYDRQGHLIKNINNYEPDNINQKILL